MTSPIMLVLKAVICLFSIERTQTPIFTTFSLAVHNKFKGKVFVSRMVMGKYSNLIKFYVFTKTVITNQSL